MDKKQNSEELSKLWREAIGTPDSEKCLLKVMSEVDPVPPLSIKNKLLAIGDQAVEAKAVCSSLTLNYSYRLMPALGLVGAIFLITYFSPLFMKGHQSRERLSEDELILSLVEDEMMIDVLDADMARLGEL
ncbi:MAG: hypothetical protein IT292_11620 [Deltaproteobacteria bacterium]|nr:hypothetical protein [Deltaproteobacteria bacterium]